MVFNVHRNHKIIRDGEKGVQRRLEKREIIYLSLHCHHLNDFCIKMGSDESHFYVSLIVRDKVTRRRPQTTAFEEKGEPKRIRTEIPLLTSLTPTVRWTWSDNELVKLCTMHRSCLLPFLSLVHWTYTMMLCMHLHVLGIIKYNLQQC